MGRWLKVFLDGDCYEGTDEDVRAGRASWRKSRNTGIAQVHLSHNGRHLRIIGPGDYWQEDVCEAVFGEGVSRIVKRRIMRKLEPSDLYFHHQRYGNGVHVSFVKNGGGTAQMVPSTQQDKWFVLELDTRTGEISYHYRSEVE